MKNQSATIVIFGASGDLTRRKLMPALYNRYCKERLPEQFHIVGFARTRWDSQQFQEEMEQAVVDYAQLDATTWDSFAGHLHYVAGAYDSHADFRQLDETVAGLEQGEAGRLYYLSTPPKLYGDIIAALGECGMVAEEASWRRVVIEKPFGHDLASAQDLNRQVHDVLAERQVYRIDHYLGKETVQNLLVLRFANTIFEPVWNRNYIANVQITAAETLDVGRRAGYYDGVGVLRDMFQNHLLQLLALVSMEPPVSFEADALRNEKVKVLNALRPLGLPEVARYTVRGQYRGYLDEEGVQSGSQTATYAAVQLFIDNWRWQGVPFYLRSGKALAAKTTEMVIQFKRPPHMMFPLPPEKRLTSNLLAICIQPDEAIHLRFEAKVPDSVVEMRSVDMEFHYAQSFGPAAIPDAYERLLLDALSGDAGLFTRADENELAWKLVDSILAGWESAHAPPLATYERGSWGPEAADELTAGEGCNWQLTCGRHG
jgi:glucose-6-phosphate 1-dehydrogenase